ncbi:SIS domain-containing protein [Anaerorhabdus furcosa]|uniref:SIS domain-containing protein n=1 Tax=Anaerorhabdus furcosa TaxID=118967 RepID=A0A1T4K714_9FIRM|nr:SIS domain-containing protein [Anaerorhabdus furcosa]SJZ38230.1 SIS domain-containing protein [Anaerorhabdus furcosa]
MDNYDTISENAMLEYIHETPTVLKNILDNRKEYTKEFVDDFVENKYSKVIIIGSGTSYHGGLSSRAFMERTLKVTVDANYPLLYKNFTSVFNEKTVVIGISQGGESKSTIQGLEYSKDHGCKTVSLTEAGKDSKLAAYSDIALCLACGTEVAGPKTKGYQATMMMLVVMALETGLALNTITLDEYNKVLARLYKIVENLDHVINESINWYNRNREDFLTAKRILLVGYKNNFGNILEGRLKIEEAVRYGIEGYELEEFMHGIYHSIDEGVHLVYLAQDDEFKERSVKLKNFMGDYSSHQFMIGDLGVNSSKDMDFKFVNDKEFCAFEYIIPLQCLAFFLSKDLGINANIPKIRNFHYLLGSK